MSETISPVTIVNPDQPKHRPVILLPKNLGALSKLCAKDVGRYSMTGVRIISTERGYRCEATDGRYLGIVTGPVEDAESYPALPQLASAPNHEMETVCPAKEFLAACKAAPKKVYNPIMRQNIAAVFGKVTSEIGTVEAPLQRVEHVTTLASTDGVGVTCSAPRLEASRFPNVNDVFPKDNGEAVTIDIDPKRLAELLLVAAEFMTEDTRRVTLTLHPYRTTPNGDKISVPMEVSAKNPNGQEFRGLLMPLS